MTGEPQGPRTCERCGRIITVDNFGAETIGAWEGEEMRTLTGPFCKDCVRQTAPPKVDRD